MMKSVGKKFTERILFAGDTSCDPAKVQTVLLTAGKHYYTLNEKREFLGVKNVAIVRLESYCPFPTLQLQQEVAKFPNAKCKSFFF
jgi:2-oxoglutarate dehydrogenase complex dehydrogenase (E1) component-like enzyme